MSMAQKAVNLEIVRSALQELANVEYQWRVWVKGSATEMSSMNEATAALFNDSNLDIALEKNAVIFSPAVDTELRELRALLQSSQLAERKHGTAKVIASVEWKDVCDRAARILGSIPPPEKTVEKPGRKNRKQYTKKRDSIYFQAR